MENQKQRAPALFVNHGGGPLPLLNDERHHSLINHLKSITQTFEKPKAILMISAHFEENQLSILENQSGQLLYDYKGFTEVVYQYKYPAPTSREVVYKVKGLLARANFEDPKVLWGRGYDHGIFVPLTLMYPQHDIPVVGLSIVHNGETFDPDYHFRLGQAIGSLREEGILVLGSGQTYHNLKKLTQPGAYEDSIEFDAYLQDALCNPEYSVDQRKQLIVDWDKAPKGRDSHPREDHLVPLFVIAGAGMYQENQVPKKVFDETLLKVKVSGFMYE